MSFRRLTNARCAVMPRCSPVDDLQKARDLGDDGLYVRVYHYLMPAQQLRGNVTNWAGGRRADVPKLDGHIWVPIDDEHTWVYNMMYGYDADVPITEEFAWKDEAFVFAFLLDALGLA